MVLPYTETMSGATIETFPFYKSRGLGADNGIDTEAFARRLAELSVGREKLLVLLGDRSLRMPLRLQAPMKFVAAHDSFRVADLEPWLDPESRLVVARRLVREGLLRIAG